MTNICSSRHTLLYTMKKTYFTGPLRVVQIAVSSTACSSIEFRSLHALLLLLWLRRRPAPPTPLPFSVDTLLVVEERTRYPAIVMLCRFRNITSFTSPLTKNITYILGRKIHDIISMEVEIIPKARYIMGPNDTVVLVVPNSAAYAPMKTSMDPAEAKMQNWTSW